MKESSFLIMLMVAPFFISCVSLGSDKEISQELAMGKKIVVEPRYPEWVMSPPKSEGYYFGIGVGPDLETAKIKSIINAGQQFKVRIHSELLEKTSGLDGQDDIVKTIEKQITDQGVVGAKFHDQFLDANGEYWVLTRAPLTCVLDVSESVLVSYKRDLKIENYVIEDVVQTVSNKLESSTEYVNELPEAGNTETLPSEEQTKPLGILSEKDGTGKKESPGFSFEAGLGSAYSSYLLYNINKYFQNKSLVKGSIFFGTEFFTPFKEYDYELLTKDLSPSVILGERLIFGKNHRFLLESSFIINIITIEDENLDPGKEKSFVFLSGTISAGYQFMSNDGFIFTISGGLLERITKYYYIGDYRSAVFSMSVGYKI